MSSAGAPCGDALRCRRTLQEGGELTGRGRTVGDWQKHGLKGTGCLLLGGLVLEFAAVKKEDIVYVCVRGDRVKDIGIGQKLIQNVVPASIAFPVGSPVVAVIAAVWAGPVAAILTGTSGVWSEMQL